MTDPAPLPATRPRRAAVVDLGSNSVRLVVFEGTSRNPVTIFNEKGVVRLGRGLENSGLLNPEGVDQAVALMRRFHAVARSMQADPFEVLATAAVRDAGNGQAFVARLRDIMPGVPIRILSGEEEADYAATGVLCGLPDADGVVADIGGGSLELVRLRNGAKHQARTLRLGVIRLSDRAEGDLVRARALVEQDLADIDWFPEAAGRTLYLVGGAFRALARLQIARVFYPLNIVHQYEMRSDEAREMTGWIIGSSRRALERLPGAPRKRLEDLPYAAIVLRRLLRRLAPARIVFCVDGLREGWYMRHVAPEVMTQDPLEAAARELAARSGRNDALPPALIEWTQKLFEDPGCDPEGAGTGASGGACGGLLGESLAERRLRVSACWMSDCGVFDHPEYRAEQTFLRVLRQPGMAFDHPSRAFLALTLAMRYEAELDQPFLQPARRLLDNAGFRRAEILGLALRLAYTLCAGVPELLDGTSLTPERSPTAGGPDRLVLRLGRDRGMFSGESVSRRLDRLAQAIGLQADILTA